MRCFVLWLGVLGLVLGGACGGGQPAVPGPVPTAGPLTTGTVGALSATAEAWTPVLPGLSDQDVISLVADYLCPGAPSLIGALIQRPEWFSGLGARWRVDVGRGAEGVGFFVDDATGRVTTSGEAARSIVTLWHGQPSCR